MLSDHYQNLGHVSMLELEENLSTLASTRNRRIDYICRVIEARAYQVFKQAPKALCEELNSEYFSGLFSLLAREQQIDQVGCFCPDIEAAPLRQGGFPNIKEAIADWPVAELVEQARDELQQTGQRGGSSTREPIYTGGWWSINLFDSSIENQCPAEVLFPKTLELLRGTNIMKRSLRIVKKAQSESQRLIARLSCLGAQTRIEPHFGLNLWKTRLHIPIHIPSDNCFIIAGKEQRNWVENQILTLDDTYLHAVSNNSTETRIILLVDVINPCARLAQVHKYSR